MDQGNQSGDSDTSVSRRDLIGTLAAGAAVSAAIGTPAAAQAAKTTSVMAEATETDYVRDPMRWGKPEIAALFPGFKHLDIRTSGATIRLRHGGSGPPLLLLQLATSPLLKRQNNARSAPKPLRQQRRNVGSVAKASTAAEKKQLARCRRILLTLMLTPA